MDSEEITLIDDGSRSRDICGKPALKTGGRNNKAESQDKAQHEKDDFTKE